jgi:hypothetical protein
MKRFATIFILGLLAFGLANGISYYLRSDSARVMDGFRSFGFPFMVWREGGFAGISEFRQSALFGNIGVAVLLNALAGYIWRVRHVDT